MPDIQLTPYTEAQPVGPTEPDGDPAGPWQMSRAYARRFTRPQGDGVHHLVIDVACYAANASPTPEVELIPVLSRSYGYTVCTDPADPLGTEVASYTSYEPDTPLPHGRGPFTDDDAATLCAQVDPARFTWDGHPDPTHP